MAFLNDKQSLILCGVMTASIFVGGLLDILSNFVVLTVLTLIFLAIILNLFLIKKDSEEEKHNE
tara:strand:+ start:1299 stop:1490 length:192 start_codon:yes stop_codon:yes gene_type:complete